MMSYFVLLVITISYVLYRLKNKRKFKLAKEFDGPLEIPVFGKYIWYINFTTICPESLIVLHFRKCIIIHTKITAWYVNKQMFFYT